MVAPTAGPSRQEGEQSLDQIFCFPHRDHDGVREKFKLTNGGAYGDRDFPAKGCAMGSTHCVAFSRRSEPVAAVVRRVNACMMANFVRRLRKTIPQVRCMLANTTGSRRRTVLSQCGMLT